MGKSTISMAIFNSKLLWSLPEGNLHVFLKCSDKPIRAKWLLFPLRDGRLPKEKDRSIGGPVPFQKPYFVENSLTDWWFGT